MRRMTAGVVRKSRNDAGIRRNHAGIRRAFTLIEVMIVIAIVLALSGLIGVALFRQRDAAKADLARTDMNSLKQALDLFRLDFDRYPSDEEGLKALWDKSAMTSETDQAKWKGYMRDPMATDKWGSPWGYRQVSEHGDESKYDLWSYGPDKQEGTDDDLNSWSSTEADGEAGEVPPPPPAPSGP
jgi:general secretion pathway protein G